MDKKLVEENIIDSLLSKKREEKKKNQKETQKQNNKIKRAEKIVKVMNFIKSITKEDVNLNKLSSKDAQRLLKAGQKRFNKLFIIDLFLKSTLSALLILGIYIKSLPLMILSAVGLFVIFDTTFPNLVNIKSQALKIDLNNYKPFLRNIEETLEGE